MNESNFKSFLNQYCQKARVILPVYSTKPLQTPQGTPSYSCSVQLFNGTIYESQGAFSNKKSAEQNAAKLALVGLGQIPSGSGVQIADNNSTEASTSAACNATEVVSLSNETTPVKSNNIDSKSIPEGQLISSTPTFTHPKQIIAPTMATSKNLLNETAQKLRLPLPSYQTGPDSRGNGFVSTVTFNGVTYCSNGAFRLKKEAEKSAALEALKVLLHLEGTECCSSETSGATETLLEPKINSSESCSGVAIPDTSSQQTQMNIHQEDSSTTEVSAPPSTDISPLMGLPQTPPSTSEAASQQLPVSFKNLLQEYMQQRGIISGPKYDTIMADSGLFKSTVHFCGKSIEGVQEFSTKKQAEQMAARQALLHLGVEEPEKLATSRKAKARTAKLRPLKRKNHQSFRELLDLSWDSPQNSDPRLRKRPRLDENYFEPNLKLQSSLVEKSFGPIDFLSVGEIWKEKKNVAIIGNNKTSFVLHCTRVDSSLQILNTRTMENVELRPGYRIIGLDADFVQRQGRLVLQAERCADIEIPEMPDSVLISCGAVILHLDPNNSTHTEVLLKRYTDSQAFINVKAALAQFFRRWVSGNPLPLPIASLTEHIHHWTFEEVGYIAAMDMPAMQQVFLNYWKFKDSWRHVLEPVPPKDLKDLQTRAQQELAHRISCGVDTSDTNDHPWGLPKGNFRHRMLSTGLHIEKPSECAAREVREETRIQVDPSDLEKISYVDIPQDDNLNPHKGDVARYFLYVYNPIIEELNSSKDDRMLLENNAETIQQAGQSVHACEDVSKNKMLPTLGNRTEKDKEKSETVLDKSSDDEIIQSSTSSLKTKEEALLSENLDNCNGTEMKMMLDTVTVTCSVSSTFLSSSSDTGRKKVLENKIEPLATKEESQESLNPCTIKDPLNVTASIASLPSPSSSSSSSSRIKKKTPLNTDFETETFSSESSDLSLIGKTDPICPTMHYKENSLNSTEDSTKILTSKENTSEMEAKGTCKDDLQEIVNSRKDSVPPEAPQDNESCSYRKEKRGQKRKRDLSEDEESESDNERFDDMQQGPGTSTPATDVDMPTYQSPSVQGAKHEECSWFSIDEALKISPTFATIYSTEKFTELLTLLKNKWT